MMFGALFFVGTQAFADDAQDALAKFNSYVQAANTYNPSLTSRYSPSAKIIRQVVKPDGTTANVTTNTAEYIKQMKLGQAGARLKGYTNSYTGATTTAVANGYKVSALRQPKGETYKLKMYQIWQKQPNGSWLIVEEMMQTKVQSLLKHADK